MRSVVAGGALLVHAQMFVGDGSRIMFTPVQPTSMTQRQAYGSPGYVQLQEGAEYPVAYMQPITYAQPAYAEQGSSWSDIAMLALVGAAVGGAAGWYSTKSRAGNVEMYDISAFDGIWGIEAKKSCFDAWDPEKPRDYNNFNPFERNDESAMCDTNGCFPGQSRGYKSPLRPDQSWDIMQKEKAMMEEFAKDPKFNLKGRPGNFSLKWQEKLGPPP